MHMLESLITVTQAYPVSAGVQSFSQGCDRAHNQHSCKDPDEHARVCRGGCWEKNAEIREECEAERREEQQV